MFVRDAASAAGPLGVAGVRQPLRLGGLAFGPVVPPQWGVAERSVDFFDVKGDVEALLAPAVARFVAAPHPALHPGRSAAIELDGERIGVIGELHPRWRQAYEIPATRSSSSSTPRPCSAARCRPSRRCRSSSRRGATSPSSSAATSTHAALMDAIDAAGESTVRGATLFDIFEPPQGAAGIAVGERSLAVRLEIRDDERTLTDEQIERIVGAVVASLGARLGARLRQQ